MEPADEITRRHVVVIGASAGGVETLATVVRDLPVDLAASVCVVLHLAPGSPSALAAILGRAGPLPCRSAVDGEPLRDGEILVAPPDRHLVLAAGQVSLTLGPRENGLRPSVDVLFRTAAAAHGGKVVGVVLSGTRDDGTAGLAAIKANGGLAIVQDPAEALYPGMPSSALAHVTADAVVPSDQVAAAIVRAVGGDLEPARPSAPGRGGGAPAGADPAPGLGGGRPVNSSPPAGESVSTTCPECSGVLTEHVETGVIQWRCRVGHRYSPESLADAQAEGVERALWAALSALEDRESLLSRVAEHFEAGGYARSANGFRRRAHEAGRQADVVRATLGGTVAGALPAACGSVAVGATRRGAA